MWEHRNGILHNNKNLITRSMVVQLNARVSRVYTDLSSRALGHNDHHLVHLSLYALLQKDTNYKVMWLSVAELAIQDCRRAIWQQTSCNDSMVQGMQ
jgi:hypothetical protein